MSMLRDLITSDDGKTSTAKIAALMGHVNFWAAFVKFQILGEVVFNEAVWVCYGGFAIVHAVVNRGIDATKDIKADTNSTNVQIAAATGVPPNEGATTGTVTTTTKTDVQP